MSVKVNNIYWDSVRHIVMSLAYLRPSPTHPKKPTTWPRWS